MRCAGVAVVSQSRATPLTLLPWVAHAYTATGAVLAFAATRAAFLGDERSAFLALIAATLVDASDGALARTLRVTERLPEFDGARLDDIIDYLTYVFVPAVVMWRAELLPPGSGVWVLATVLMASAYGFGQRDAKTHTTDHAFTGFPSYWNIVALYLFVWHLAPAVNAVVLLALALLVFVPVRYVYPTRTVTLRGPTLTLSALWAALLVVMAWRLPATNGPWMPLSLVFVVYYFVLSLWLHFRSSTS